ncbi:LemA family protein [Thiomicrorhabdus sp. Milos-T2]|uniref:LemA family protein n=1 Tax=Thiomicrorhabdus sp. Milos-T2 TaxID=90814 RepID=UPI000AC9CECC|nr:LemA family protein [Thiomicrorhabdus sp. Milos-T2]
MSTGMIVFLVLVVLFILYLINIFNTLVALKNRFENAFAQIDVQLKRRYDLIPNLIEVAKKAMAHERETLEAVIAARNEASSLLKAAAANPGDSQIMGQLSNAEGVLGGAMSRFNMVMEAYPDLKTNQNMMQLTEELTSTENKVAFARQAFNDAVMAYNTYRQSFPQTVFAGMFGHPVDAQMLEFADREAIQEVPKVQF